MTTQSPLRMLAIVARPEDMSVAGDGTPQRYAAEGIDITVIVAAHGSTTQHGLQGVRELVLLNSFDDDPRRTVCELVSHLRRIRPQVVLTLGPDQPNPIGQLATTAVLLAADMRFGHTCTSRGPHTISKLCYLAPDAGSWYSVLNTVQPGTPDDEDLFAGLRQPAPIRSQAA
jgi:LmbE family N-acetylglucosaminyl deacetylase